MKHHGRELEIRHLSPTSTLGLSPLSASPHASYAQPVGFGDGSM
jgi:hypothetical protein